MIIYGIPNCNTVKKALDWIRANGIVYQFHNFKKEGISAEKLTEWFDTFGWEQVINKNGLTFKKLSKEEQAEINSPQKVIAYLMQNTSAIKRPIVEKNGKAILLGFNEDTYLKELL
ncbi:MAG: Spx/MgsR family RNA polymerase-binding regulatory protein [Sphingobacteriaceae bacterium]|jgi:Spx/MgsR family transcriptional regulator|nr:Spx/MgsR family RNA polymerase-binding regulatory protein [Sphingobacteriaceae bacterium]